MRGARIGEHCRCDAHATVIGTIELLLARALAGRSRREWALRLELRRSKHAVGDGI